jgi:hypothetical protein
MKSVRQFGAILLLLVSCAAPAMACMAPGAQMTAEERACCRMMKSQCRQMDLSISHGCCKKAPMDDRDNALRTDTASSHAATFVAIPVSSFELLIPQGASGGRAQGLEHSPPKSPPSATTVLRI